MPSLVKILANLAQKSATVHGVTPLGEPIVTTEPIAGTSTIAEDDANKYGSSPDEAQSSSQRKDKVHESDQYFLGYSFDNSKVGGVG